MLTCSINKVLVSRGERTATPPDYILHILPINYISKIHQRSTVGKEATELSRARSTGGAGPKPTRDLWLKWSHGYNRAKRFRKRWDAGDHQGVATAAGGAPWEREAFGKARRSKDTQRRCSMTTHFRRASSFWWKKGKWKVREGQNISSWEMYFVKKSDINKG